MRPDVHHMVIGDPPGSRCGLLYPLMLASLISGAPAAMAQEQLAESNPTFKRLDVNHDGYVTRDEAKALQGFEQAFTQADDDGDGRLDPDEFVKAQSIHDSMRAAQFVNDSVVTARIKMELIKDPQISALDVKVETDRGTVLLSGFVHDEEQARRAAQIASGVRGVTAVKNSLVIKGGS